MAEEQKTQLSHLTWNTHLYKTLNPLLPSLTKIPKPRTENDILLAILFPKNQTIDHVLQVEWIQIKYEDLMTKIEENTNNIRYTTIISIPIVPPLAHIFDSNNETLAGIITKYIIKAITPESTTVSDTYIKVQLMVDMKNKYDKIQYENRLSIVRDQDMTSYHMRQKQVDWYQQRNLYCRVNPDNGKIQAKIAKKIELPRKWQSNKYVVRFGINHSAAKFLNGGTEPIQERLRHVIKTKFKNQAKLPPRIRETGRKITNGQMEVRVYSQTSCIPRLINTMDRFYHLPPDMPVAEWAGQHNIVYTIKNIHSTNQKKEVEARIMNHGSLQALAEDKNDYTIAFPMPEKVANEIMVADDPAHNSIQDIFYQYLRKTLKENHEDFTNGYIPWDKLQNYKLTIHKPIKPHTENWEEQMDDHEEENKTKESQDVVDEPSNKEKDILIETQGIDRIIYERVRLLLDNQLWNHSTKRVNNIYMEIRKMIKEHIHDNKTAMQASQYMTTMLYEMYTSKDKTLPELTYPQQIHPTVKNDHHKFEKLTHQELEEYNDIIQKECLKPKPGYKHAMEEVLHHLQKARKGNDIHPEAFNLAFLRLKTDAMLDPNTTKQDREYYLKGIIHAGKFGIKHVNDIKEFAIDYTRREARSPEILNTVSQAQRELQNIQEEREDIMDLMQITTATGHTSTTEKLMNYLVQRQNDRDKIQTILAQAYGIIEAFGSLRALYQLGNTCHHGLIQHLDKVIDKIGTNRWNDIDTNCSLDVLKYYWSVYPRDVHPTTRYKQPFRSFAEKRNNYIKQQTWHNFNKEKAMEETEAQHIITHYMTRAREYLLTNIIPPPHKEDADAHLYYLQQELEETKHALRSLGVQTYIIPIQRRINYIEEKRIIMTDQQKEKEKIQIRKSPERIPYTPMVTELVQHKDWSDFPDYVQTYENYMGNQFQQKEDMKKADHQYLLKSIIYLKTNQKYPQIRIQQVGQDLSQPTRNSDKESPKMDTRMLWTYLIQETQEMEIRPSNYTSTLSNLITKCDPQIRGNEDLIKFFLQCKLTGRDETIDSLNNEPKATYRGRVLLEVERDYTGNYVLNNESFTTIILDIQQNITKAIKTHGIRGITEEARELRDQESELRKMLVLTRLWGREEDGDKINKLLDEVATKRDNINSQTVQLWTGETKIYKQVQGQTVKDKTEEELVKEITDTVRNTNPNILYYNDEHQGVFELLYYQITGERWNKDNQSFIRPTIEKDEIHGWNEYDQINYVIKKLNQVTEGTASYRPGMLYTVRRLEIPLTRMVRERVEEVRTTSINVNIPIRRLPVEETIKALKLEKEKATYAKYLATIEQDIPEVVQMAKQIQKYNKQIKKLQDEFNNKTICITNLKTEPVHPHYEPRLTKTPWQQLLIYIKNKEITQNEMNQIHNTIRKSYFKTYGKNMKNPEQRTAQEYAEEIYQTNFSQHQLDQIEEAFVKDYINNAIRSDFLIYGSYYIANTTFLNWEEMEKWTPILLRIIAKTMLSTMEPRSYNDLITFYQANLKATQTARTLNKMVHLTTGRRDEKINAVKNNMTKKLKQIHITYQAILNTENTFPETFDTVDTDIVFKTQLRRLGGIRKLALWYTDLNPYTNTQAIDQISECQNLADGRPAKYTLFSANEQKTIFYGITTITPENISSYKDFRNETIDHAEEAYEALTIRPLIQTEEDRKITHKFIEIIRRALVIMAHSPREYIEERYDKYVKIILQTTTPSKHYPWIRFMEDQETDEPENNTDEDETDSPFKITLDEIFTDPEKTAAFINGKTSKAIIEYIKRQAQRTKPSKQQLISMILKIKEAATFLIIQGNQDYVHWALTNENLLIRAIMSEVTGTPTDKKSESLRQQLTDTEEEVMSALGIITASEAKEIIKRNKQRREQIIKHTMDNPFITAQNLTATYYTKNMMIVSDVWQEYSVDEAHFSAGAIIYQICRTIRRHHLNRENIRTLMRTYYDISVTASYSAFSSFMNHLIDDYVEIIIYHLSKQKRPILKNRTLNEDKIKIIMDIIDDPEPLQMTTYPSQEIYKQIDNRMQKIYKAMEEWEINQREAKNNPNDNNEQQGKDDTDHTETTKGKQQQESAKDTASEQQIQIRYSEMTITQLLHHVIKIAEEDISTKEYINTIITMKRETTHNPNDQNWIFPQIPTIVLLKIRNQLTKNQSEKPYTHMDVTSHNTIIRDVKTNNPITNAFIRIIIEREEYGKFYYVGSYFDDLVTLVKECRWGNYSEEHIQQEVYLLRTGHMRLFDENNRYIYYLTSKQITNIITTAWDKDNQTIGLKENAATHLRLTVETDKYQFDCMKTLKDYAKSQFFQHIIIPQYIQEDTTKDLERIIPNDGKTLLHIYHMTKRMVNKPYIEIITAIVDIQNYLYDNNKGTTSILQQIPPGIIYEMVKLAWNAKRTDQEPYTRTIRRWQEQVKIYMTFKAPEEDWGYIIDNHLQEFYKNYIKDMQMEFYKNESLKHLTTAEIETHQKTSPARHIRWILKTWKQGIDITQIPSHAKLLHNITNKQLSIEKATKLLEDIYQTSISKKVQDHPKSPTAVLTPDINYITKLSQRSRNPGKYDDIIESMIRHKLDREAPSIYNKLYKDKSIIPVTRNLTMDDLIRERNRYWRRIKYDMGGEKQTKEQEKALREYNKTITKILVYEEQQYHHKQKGVEQTLTEQQIKMKNLIEADEELDKEDIITQWETITNLEHFTQVDKTHPNGWCGLSSFTRKAQKLQKDKEWDKETRKTEINKYLREFGTTIQDDFINTFWITKTKVEKANNKNRYFHNKTAYKTLKDYTRIMITLGIETELMQIFLFYTKTLRTYKAIQKKKKDKRGKVEQQKQRDKRSINKETENIYIIEDSYETLKQLFQTTSQEEQETDKGKPNTTTQTENSQETVEQHKEENDKEFEEFIQERTRKMRSTESPVKWDKQEQWQEPDVFNSETENEEDQNEQTITFEEFIKEIRKEMEVKPTHYEDTPTETTEEEPKPQTTCEDTTSQPTRPKPIPRKNLRIDNTTEKEQETDKQREEQKQTPSGKEAEEKTIEIIVRSESAYAMEIQQQSITCRKLTTRDETLQEQQKLQHTRVRIQKKTIQELNKTATNMCPTGNQEEKEELRTNLETILGRGKINTTQITNPQMYILGLTALLLAQLPLTEAFTTNRTENTSEVTDSYYPYQTTEIHNTNQTENTTEDIIEIIKIQYPYQIPRDPNQNHLFPHYLIQTLIFLLMAVCFILIHRQGQFIITAVIAILITLDPENNLVREVNAIRPRSIPARYANVRDNNWTFPTQAELDARAQRDLYTERGEMQVRVVETAAPVVKLNKRLRYTHKYIFQTMKETLSFNDNHIVVAREINMDPMYDIYFSMKVLEEGMATICNRLQTTYITQGDIPNFFIVHTHNEIVHDQYTECLRSDSTFPEIRTKSQARALATFMDKNDIYHTPAGTMLRGNYFQFYSNSEVMPILDQTYLQQCKDDWTWTYETTYYYTKPAAKNTNLFICPKPMHDKVSLNYRVICQPRNVTTTFHNTYERCRANAETMTNTLEAVRQNIIDMDPSRTWNARNPWNGTTTEAMQKRGALIPLVAATAGVLLGLAVGKEIFGNLFGGAGIETITYKDGEKLREAINKNTIKLKELSIGQNTILVSVQEINNRVQQLIAANLILYDRQSIENKMLELMIRFNEFESVFADNIIQMTTAFTVARKQITSEFLLKPSELEQVAKRLYHDMDITITTDLQKIKTTVYALNNYYNVLFEIPVEDKSRIASLYKVTPIVGYNKMIPFQPLPYVYPLEQPYLVITNNSQYTMLSETEALKCMEGNCYIPQPFLSIQHWNRTCVISEFFKFTMEAVPDGCQRVTDLKLYAKVQNNPEHSLAFFYTMDHYVIYSVPNKQKIDITCKTLTRNTRHQIENLDQFGHIELAWRCKLITELNTTIYGQNAKITNLDQMFKQLQWYRSIPNVTVYRITEDNPKDILPIETRHAKQITDLMKKRMEEPIQDIELLEKFKPLVISTFKWGMIDYVIMAAVAMGVFLCLLGLMQALLNVNWNTLRQRCCTQPNTQNTPEEGQEMSYREYTRIDDVDFPPDQIYDTKDKEEVNTQITETPETSFEIIDSPTRVMRYSTEEETKDENMTISQLIIAVQENREDHTETQKMQLCLSPTQHNKHDIPEQTTLPQTNIGKVKFADKDILETIIEMEQLDDNSTVELLYQTEDKSMSAQNQETNIQANTITNTVEEYESDDSFLPSEELDRTLKAAEDLLKAIQKSDYHLNAQLQSFTMTKMPRPNHKYKTTPDGRSQQAAMPIEQMYHPSQMEFTTKTGLRTPIYPITKDNRRTAILIGQHPDNHIDYSHPIVRREHRIHQQPNHQYYVLKTHPTTYIVTNEEQEERIDIPNPSEPAPITPGQTHIPYLYKETIAKEMINKQHPDNPIDYTHQSIKVNAQQEFYQVFQDDKYMYHRQILPPNQPIKTKLENIFAKRTHKDNQDIIWHYKDKLIQQHPNNMIDYTHPSVRRIHKNGEEIYYTLPNLPPYHVTGERDIYKEQYRIPRPEEKAGQTQPLLTKLIYFTEQPEKRQAVKGNNIDYSDYRVKLNSNNEFYFIQEEKHTILARLIPSPQQKHIYTKPFTVIPKRN